MTSTQTMAISESAPSAKSTAVRDARCKARRSRTRVTAQDPFLRCTAQHGWQM